MEWREGKESAPLDLNPGDATANYETVDAQRQGEQPHYDVVAFDHIATRPPIARRQSYN